MDDFTEALNVLTFPLRFTPHLQDAQRLSYQLPGKSAGNLDLLWVRHEEGAASVSVNSFSPESLKRIRSQCNNYFGGFNWTGGGGAI